MGTGYLMLPILLFLSHFGNHEYLSYVDFPYSCKTIIHGVNVFMVPEEHIFN